MAKKANIKHPRVKTEFKEFLPELDESELSILEASILRDGISNDVIVWHGFIVDGHHRVAMARKHGLKYKIRELPRTMSKQDVLAWMAEYQLGQRNCSSFTKIMVALNFEQYYRAKAKGNQRLSPGRGKKACHQKRQPFQPIDTLSRVGEIAGVKRNAVSQVKYILKNASKDVIHKCQSGVMNIRTGYLKGGDRARRRKRQQMTDAPVKYRNPKAGTYINKIIRGNCNKMMVKMAQDGLKGKITCVACSPPYNNSTSYGNGHDDNLPYRDYIDWLGQTFLTASNLLRPGGRLIVNVANMTNQQDEDKGNSYKHTTNVDLIRKIAELDCDLRYRDEIIWHKNNGTVMNTSHGSWCSPSNPIIKTVHEYILIWSNGDWRLPNITGQEPDLCAEEFEKAVTSVWPVSSISHKSNHPATFPQRLIVPLIKLYSYPGDIILDPFNGSGTTTVCAAKTGRQYIGIDQNAAYCDFAKKRTAAARSK